MVAGVRHRPNQKVIEIAKKTSCWGYFKQSKMEHQSWYIPEFYNPRIKAVSSLNAVNKYCFTSDVEYKCRCQAVGCPLPIIVKAQSSRQAPSVPRMYPQFAKAAIQPISAKETGASEKPFNNHSSQYIWSKTSGNHLKNFNTSTHLQFHRPGLDQMLNKNSKDEQKSYHRKLTVTCKAPTNWLRMKWGRV